MDEALTRLCATASRSNPAGPDQAPASALARRPVESLTLGEALGRVLAADVCSPISVPPADNSAMDGYAVRVSDVPVAGTVLPVSQRIAAGHPGQPLQPGTAARIFTGAFVPGGADAVVMQEQTAPQDDGRVRFDVVPVAGQAIRHAGEDIRSGQIVLAAGTRLDAAALGLAAAVGLARLPVFARLKVAVFFTGDELVSPGDVAPAALPPGKIFNSNRPVLTGLLSRLGCEVIDLGQVPDSLAATQAALAQAAAQAELVITCGGVSVGEEDHVKPAVQSMGQLDVWQVAIKPGKPLAFGRLHKPGQPGEQALFVGLPGNPVSSYVTLLMLVRPLVLQLQGRADAQVPPAGVLVPAASPWPLPGSKVDKRREFLRARLNHQGHAELYPNQGSGVLTSVAWAEGLIDNPPGTGFQVGEMIRFVPLASLVS